MIDLPDDVRARIETILADVELAAVKIDREPARFERGSGRLAFIYSGPPTDRIQAVVLDAIATIIQATEPLTASHRRQTVEHYQAYFLKRYTLDTPRFQTVLRKQSWWMTFQQTLRQAAPPPVPESTVHPTSSQPPLRSVHDQLIAFIQEFRITTPELADATGFTQRTIEHHLHGDQPLTRKTTIKAYEKGLTQLSGQTIKFDLPPEFWLPRHRHTPTPKPPRKTAKPPRKTAKRR